MPLTPRQKVYIANFGHENYLWKDCREHDTLGMFQSEDLQPFWSDQDREGYVAHCIATRKTAAGKVMTATVAGRWFNLGTEFLATSGDVWSHHDEGALWWTISKPDEVTTSLEAAGPGRPAGDKVYVLRKPARPWSNANDRGAVLAWDGLHARAREFLFLEGTFHALVDDNAEFVLALIAGDDLGPWYSRPDWKAKEDKAGKGPVITFDGWKVSAVNLANIARATVAGSNGQQVLRTVKNKEIRFASIGELVQYIVDLIAEQKGRCALTGLAMQQFGRETDGELLCSLDRKNSDGHYERGNLQVVCRFANRWKSDGTDQEFRRLIALVRAGGNPG